MTGSLRDHFLPDLTTALRLRAGDWLTGPWIGPRRASVAPAKGIRPAAKNFAEYPGPSCCHPRSSSGHAEQRKHGWMRDQSRALVVKATLVQIAFVGAFRPGHLHPSREPGAATRSRPDRLDDAQSVTHPIRNGYALKALHTELSGRQPRGRVPLVLPRRFQ